MKRRVLVGMFAGGLMLTVAYAFAQGPGPGGPGMHGPGMHGPGMMRQMITARLDAALGQANVTPEQRAAIYASRDRAFAAMDAQRPDPAAQRDQMLALFEGDRLDAAQLDAVHEQMQQRHEAMRAAITQAIIEVHDTLTPVQRKAVADYIRANPHGPFGMH